MRGNFLPKLGQCIDTPNGGGVVSLVRPLANGDFTLTVVRFATHELECVTMSEWNGYEDMKMEIENEQRVLFKQQGDDFI